MLKQNVTITNDLKAKPLHFWLTNLQNNSKRRFLAYTTSAGLILSEFISFDSLQTTIFQMPNSPSSILFGENIKLSDVNFPPYGSFVLVLTDVLGNKYEFNFNKWALEKSAEFNQQFFDGATCVYGTALVTKSKLVEPFNENLSFSNPLKLGILIDNENFEKQLGELIKRDFYPFVLYNDNYLEFFKKDESNIQLKIQSQKDIKSFSIGDIKNDGNNYVIVNAGDKLLAYNKNGSLASDFPIYHPNKKNFVGQVYLSDLNSDQTPDLICETEDGQLLCFNPLTGKLMEKYRVSLGIGSHNSSALVNEDGKLYYHTISDLS
ncbi:MAG: hypothetical protein N3A61_03905, partial [Ignavibacteria bacterium]|nr:hypothetical protein [Ignavibacteria bacterium]